MGERTPDFALDHLRSHDFDWYAALLFAGSEKRADLAALFAFLAEIARIRSLVSNPMPCEIRLQYWRDVLSGTSHGERGTNPLAAGLMATLGACKLPAAPLLAAIDARQFDLYDDAMPSVNDLEGHAGEVISGPFSFAATMLSGREPAQFADLAGHSGVALVVARILADFSAWTGRGQCYLPADLMQAHALSRDALREPSPQRAACLRALAAHGLEHLAKAERAAGDAPASVYPLLLPLVLARGLLERAESWAVDPLGQSQSLVLPRWRRLYAFWSASRRMPDF